MYEFKFPFEPPLEDLKMTVTTASGAKVFIYDTCCKNFTPEDKARIDKKIIQIYTESALKKAALETERQNQADSKEEKAK